MRLFATLHSRYYQSPELDTTLKPFSRWEDFFTITCEDAGFTDACIRGFTMAEEVIPARLFQREAEVWPATLRCTELHKTMPRGLNHSDVHLKNWYITPSGEMGINDWQNAAKGNGGRNLAYCIATSLSVDKRRLWEKISSAILRGIRPRRRPPARLRHHVPALPPTNVRGTRVVDRHPRSTTRCTRHATA